METNNNKNDEQANSPLDDRDNDKDKDLKGVESRSNKANSRHSSKPVSKKQSEINLNSAKQQQQH